MAQHNPKDEQKQKAAANFLRDLLQRNHGRPFEDIANAISSLAFEETNPVRDLFLSVNAHGLSTSPPRSHGSRSSSRMLQLARRGHKPGASEGKTSTPSEQQNDKQKTAASSVAGKSSKTVTEANSAVAPYKCIICNEDMSYKGVCKRHLDEQHVSPNIFQCERCGQCFGTKSEAKKHSVPCGNGTFHWNVVKPALKVIYASEYTDEWFTSKSTYLEHLLKLSKRGGLRPQPSLHRKLRSLLSHPSLREDVVDASESTHASGDAWKRLRYSDSQLRRAIRTLEDAAIVDKDGYITFHGGLDAMHHALNIRHYLHNFFGTGVLREEATGQPNTPGQGSESKYDGRRTSMSTNTTIKRGPSPATTYTSLMSGHHDSNIPTNYWSGGTSSRMDPIPRDLRIKRHHSDLSGSTEPLRQPPGPPPIPTSDFQHPTGVIAHPTVEHNGLMHLVPETLTTMPPPNDVTSKLPVTDASVQMPMYNLSNTSAPVQLDANGRQMLLSLEQMQEQLQHTGPMAYNVWAPVQPMNYEFSFKDLDYRELRNPDYCLPSDTSARTSSIDTERTYFDSSEDEQKMADYSNYLPYVPAALGTFLLDDDDSHDMPELQQGAS